MLLPWSLLLGQGLIKNKVRLWLGYGYPLQRQPLRVRDNVKATIRRVPGYETVPIWYWCLFMSYISKQGHQWEDCCCLYVVFFFFFKAHCRVRVQAGRGCVYISLSQDTTRSMLASRKGAGGDCYFILFTCCGSDSGNTGIINISEFLLVALSTS